MSWDYSLEITCMCLCSTGIYSYNSSIGYFTPYNGLENIHCSSSTCARDYSTAVVLSWLVRTGRLSCRGIPSCCCSCNIRSFCNYFLKDQITVCYEIMLHRGTVCKNKDNRGLLMLQTLAAWLCLRLFLLLPLFLLGNAIQRHANPLPQFISFRSP